MWTKHYDKWMPALVAGGAAIAGASVVKVPITAVVQLPLWYIVAWCFGKAREQQGEMKGLARAGQKLDEIERKLEKISKETK